MKRPRFDLFLPFSIITVFLVILFMARSLLRLLQSSDYFIIKDILVSRDETVDLSYFKGKNIFAIDLQKESQYLAEHFPVYRKVRLVCLLPNRIFVDFIKRKPIAIIKLYRDFSVDEEGVIFDAPLESDYSDLPLILGLETKIFVPKRGRLYNIKELSFVLDIIKEMRGNKGLKSYKVKIINVANLSNASLLLIDKNQTLPQEGLEVKLDGDNIKGKFNILAGLLNQDKIDLTKTRYIDLRFKEPVIKFRDAKQ